MDCSRRLHRNACVHQPARTLQGAVDSLCWASAGVLMAVRLGRDHGLRHDLSRIKKWANPEGAVVAAWHSQTCARPAPFSSLVAQDQRTKDAPAAAMPRSVLLRELPTSIAANKSPAPGQKLAGFLNFFTVSGADPEAGTLTFSKGGSQGGRNWCRCNQCAVSLAEALFCVCPPGSSVRRSTPVRSERAVTHIQYAAGLWAGHQWCGASEEFGAGNKDDRMIGGSCGDAPPPPSLCMHTSSVLQASYLGADSVPVAHSMLSTAGGWSRMFTRSSCVPPFPPLTCGYWM